MQRSKTIGGLAPRAALVNVLGVVYVHTRTEEGGDLYLTRFANTRRRLLRVENWYEKEWFDARKVRLLGTSSVYRVPTKTVGGRSLDLVVKNCRVGEDVPLDTHTLQEFCDREFNSPWEEFSLVMEMREGGGPRGRRVRTQRPLAIYLPPERMQLWQSGRSRAKINRIRARHPGVDLDILKQYKLVYEWIRGKNLIEVFEEIELEMPDAVHHLQVMQHRVTEALRKKGYLMADMKPEHIIVPEEACLEIESFAKEGTAAAPQQVERLYELTATGACSLIDYELLFRTPEHEDRVKHSRRYSYLDAQRTRDERLPLPAHLGTTEIFGVPYVCGHAESTGGHLWVVGRSARLFDYFLPERWRKTPGLNLSRRNEVFYTVTKDNIHLVWKTSRVGELPAADARPRERSLVRRRGINSPFEEFALAFRLNRLGIHAVYVRAIYATGSRKVEPSADLRAYERHEHLRTASGDPVLQENRNYITIRGYYNGPDDWVPEHEHALLTPVDLDRAAAAGLIGGALARRLRRGVIERLRRAHFDGSLLEANDLLIAADAAGEIRRDSTGDPDVIICNLELIWPLEQERR